MRRVRGSQPLFLVLVNLSEQLLELLGQAVDFAPGAADALPTTPLQRHIAQKAPQEDA